MPRSKHLVLLAAIAVIAAGCGGSGPTVASNEAPATSASTTAVMSGSSAETPATPLHGSWRLELTEAEMSATLEAAGYGNLAEDFFVAEEIDGAITQVLTIEGGRFAFAYQSGTSPWNVGWRGPATITEDSITLNDEASTTVDTLRWAVDGDLLTFELAETSDVLLKGLPAEVFTIAYLTSAAFQRTDCTPTEGDCEG